MRSKIILLLALLATTIISCNPKENAPTPVLGAETLDCEYFKQNRTLTHDDNKKVDYIINCVMSATADIVINPGVVIEFGPDAGILVEGGSLKAAGTQANRITFTGIAKDKGSWKGILFNSNDVKNELSYINIEYAGGAPFNSNDDKAAVIVWSDTKLNVDNAMITNSASSGIKATYTRAQLTLENSKINSCNNYPIYILPSYMNKMSKTCDFGGNATGKNFVLVQINTDAINESMIWQKLNVPYRISSNYQFYKDISIDNGDVEVEPGVQIVMEQGNGIIIHQNASFYAEGNGNAGLEKIWFTGVEQYAGYWKGIYYMFTTSPKNAIANAVIKHAGNKEEGGDGAISMWGDPHVVVKDVEFFTINACAIYNYKNTDNPNLTYSNNTLLNVAGGEICHD